MNSRKIKEAIKREREMKIEMEKSLDRILLCLQEQKRYEDELIQDKLKLENLINEIDDIQSGKSDWKSKKNYI